jgi:hypothetical protein
MHSLFSLHTRVVRLIVASALALFTVAPFEACAEPAGAELIVPGKSIGRTHLGPNGAAYLKSLPKPKASDPDMSQNRLVWISGKAPDINTLFIHTTANGATDAKPPEGVTIDEIRITSREFQTREEIKCGSTLGQIRKAFPEIQPAPDTSDSVYVDAAHGIAFEFAEAAKDDSPCVAITVFLPHVVRFSREEQIAGLLKDRQ